MNTFGELAARYRAECIPLLGPRTQRAYVHHVNFLEAHFTPEREICSIKPRDVGRLLDVPRAKIHRAKQVAVLSAMMGMAVSVWFVDGCEINPCQKIKRHRNPPRSRYVTDLEFDAVRALAPFNVQLAMDLALLTGQRQGDCLDLMWSNVYATHIDVTQGKTGKHLGIRITPALAEVLQRARNYKPFLGPRKYVIRARTGDPYTHEGMRALWQRVMNEAMRLGAIRKRYSFHDLRAKCASDKKNLQGASELLGHSDQSLTRRIYVRSIQMVDPLR